MNKAFEELAEALAAQQIATRDELLDALFAMRAHRSLDRIVSCCRRLTEVADRCPEFGDEPAFPDQARRLQVVRAIGSLKLPARSRLGDGRNKGKLHSGHGLWGSEGESGLCDLLLLEPPMSAGAVHRQAYGAIQAWFAWQIFHHQARNESRDEYLRYLFDEHASLRADATWHTVDNAYQALRALFDSAVANRVDLLASAVSPFTITHSELLTRALRRLHRFRARKGGAVPGAAPDLWDVGVRDRERLVQQLALVYAHRRSAEEVDWEWARRLPLGEVWGRFPPGFLRCMSLALDRLVDPEQEDWLACLHQLRVLLASPDPKGPVPAPAAKSASAPAAKPVPAAGPKLDPAPDLKPAPEPGPWPTSVQGTLLPTSIGRAESAIFTRAAVRALRQAYPSLTEPLGDPKRRRGAAALQHFLEGIWEHPRRLAEPHRSAGSEGIQEQPHEPAGPPRSSEPDESREQPHKPAGPPRSDKPRGTGAQRHKTGASIRSNERQARRRHQLRQHILRSGTRRCDDIVVIPQEVRGTGSQDGIALDLYEDPLHPAESRDGGEAAELWTDDPADEEAVEPRVTLFLGTGDAVSGWYASRSLAHHLERANAWLRWPVWRLSDPAIRAVLRCVEVRPGDGCAAQWARLLIGLSLLTGRSLDDVGGVKFRDHRDRGKSLVIDVATGILRASSGRPKLKSLQPGALTAYCAPWVSTIELPLPVAWGPLLNTVQQRSMPSLGQVVYEARSLIAALPPDLAISETGIAGALKLALLDVGRGDLALVKAVTDASGANFNNLIHYASYDRSEVERKWRSIVSGWAGPLGVPARIDVPGGDRPRVGTPYAIEIAKVAPRIAELKAGFRAAVQEQRWADAYNRMVLYVALWLGLATAGRSSREPVPATILDAGWALIRDKHRADESTDRYVPLGDPLRQQLAILRDFTAALSLASDLALPDPGAPHLLDLGLVVQGNQVAPFHPQYLSYTTELRDLPGNWGRKVVRSNAPELSGRFLDAGLGHWVRGRHPWTLTSTFPARTFRTAWLAVQRRLEGELGFEVLRLDGLASLPPPAIVLPPRASDSVGAPEPAAPSKEQAARIDALLKRCNRGGLYRDVFEQQPPIPEASVPLAEWAISESGVTLELDVAARAEAVCARIRARTRIPLFASRPRGRFQRNWLVSQYEFANLAYLEQELLPGIHHDLGHLPPWRQTTGGVPAEKIELGRLIAALALRGGIASSQHLDALLLFIASDAPICAIGDTRLIELPVRSRRAHDTIGRTVLLEPYLAALLTQTRDRMRLWLNDWLRENKGEERHKGDGESGGNKRVQKGQVTFDAALDGPESVGASEAAGKRARTERGSVTKDERLGPEKRYARWDAALHAYLHSLGLPREISLSAFLSAVRQRIQLNAAPLLAAYASGELLTHDLPADEFARLAGRALPIPDAQNASASGSASAKRSKEPSATVVAARARRSEWKMDRRKFGEEGAPDGLPADVQDAPINLARRLSGRASAKPEAWLRRIAGERKRHTRSVEILLCDFAAYRVRTFVARRTRQRQRTLTEADSELSGRAKAWIRSDLTIVWAGLVGSSIADGDRPKLDEATAQALADHTEPYFPARAHQGAWSRFRYYLVDRHGDHAGFATGTIRPREPRNVSAKVLSRAELDRTEALLRSVRSGIGAASTRAIACRHFAVVRATGSRRAEAAQLRGVDVDGGQLRIRPYAGHTLKTPASERVLPSGLFQPEAWQGLSQRAAAGASQLIGADIEAVTAGANFFDAEARAIKASGGDQNFGPHHLRHTKANALLLKVLGTTVDLDLLKEELPWVEALLPSDHELDALVGSGGQCGQGLQAISLLLGHLHPTTTLKHYLHTLCIALYAYQRELPAIPLQVAFAARVPSRATLYRRAGQKSNAAQVAGRVRDFIEALAQEQHRTTQAKGSLLIVAKSRASGAVPEAMQGARSARKNEPFAWALRVEDLEAWHRYFATGEGSTPVRAVAMRAALRAIGRIPSGKRGSTLPRHSLPVRGQGGLRLPLMVRPGLAVAHAEQLLGWLARVERDDPQGYDWLLDKWLYASDVLEGSMRLNGEKDVDRTRALPVTQGIDLAVHCGRLSRKRRAAGARPHPRLRIRFTQAPDDQATSDSAEKENRGNRRCEWRGSGAVRWVLTWLAAARGRVNATAV